MFVATAAMAVRRRVDKPLPVRENVGRAATRRAMGCGASQVQNEEGNGYRGPFGVPLETIVYNEQVLPHDGAHANEPTPYPQRWGAGDETDCGGEEAPPLTALLSNEKHWGGGEGGEFSDRRFYRAVIKVRSQVGHGAYGSVFVGEHSHRGVVALKQVPGEVNSPERQRAEAESNVLSDLNHPSIIRLFGTLSSRSRLILVEEFHAFGDLRKLTHRLQPTEALVRAWLRQLLAALAYAHAKGVIHRDVKPSNRNHSHHPIHPPPVLVASSDHRRIVLADFGLSLRCARGALCRSAVAGSPFYMAPEMLDERPYGAAVDVWSVGCTALSLCIPPLQLKQRGLRVVAAMFTPAQMQAAVGAMHQSGFSCGLTDFVGRCLQIEAKRRPTCADLLQDPWLRVEGCDGEVAVGGGGYAQGSVETQTWTARTAPPRGQKIPPPPCS